MWAKQSPYSFSVTDHSLTPAYDLKMYYRSLMHKTWQKFWFFQISNELLPLLGLRQTESTRREEAIPARFEIGHTSILVM